MSLAEQWSAALRSKSSKGSTQTPKNVRRIYRCNNTGVCGITEQVLAKTGRRQYRYYIVTPHRRRFNIDTLGRDEAFRRALRLRAEHEQSIQRGDAETQRKNAHCVPTAHRESLRVSASLRFQKKGGARG